MKEKKRSFTDKNVVDKEPFKKMKNTGSILNLTRQRMIFPKNMEKRYCSNYLDAGRVCRYGRDCHFVHAVYPTGFTPHDKIIMEKYI